MDKIVVTFGVGNRVVIPKTASSMLGWNTGDKLKLVIENNKVYLQPVTEQNKIENKDNTIKQGKPVVVGTRKIVSNLEEGEKFKTKYYSPCKLVIRTKNRYLKEFCNDCKGLLVKDCKEKQHLCPYYDVQQPKEQLTKVKEENTIKVTKKQPVQKVTQKVTQKELKQNVEKLDNILTEHIKTLVDPNLIKEVKKEGKNIIQAIKSENRYFQCQNCEQIFAKGFMINNEFYCKDCTKQHFKKFLDKYKQVNKGGKE